MENKEIFDKCVEINNHLAKNEEFEARDKVIRECPEFCVCPNFIA